MKYKKEVWGPHYWFVLHTIAHTYPKHPNQVIKKKYYEFILNLPLLLPDITISNRFSHLLEKFPVTPYLDSRESFMKWMHFIHNRVNIINGKPTMKYEDSLDAYFKHYDLDKSSKERKINDRKKKIKIGVIISLLAGIGLYYYYDN